MVASVDETVRSPPETQTPVEQLCPVPQLAPSRTLAVAAQVLWVRMTLHEL
jgi:hypothetical protein